MKSRFAFARARGRWGQGLTANGYGVPFQGAGKVLEAVVVMTAQLCGYTKKMNHTLKMINFMVCET